MGDAEAAVRATAAVPHRYARAVLRPLARRRTWMGVLYLLVGAPAGVAWLLVLAVGFLVGGATAVLGVGLLVLLGTLALTRPLAELERRVANTLLDARIPPPAAAVPVEGTPAGWRQAAARLVVEPRTWRSLAWMLFRAVAGALVLGGAVLAALVLIALLVLPFWDGYLQWNDTWRSTSGWRNAWTLPVGLLGLLGSVHLARLLAAVHARVAQVLLSPDAGEQVIVLEHEVSRAHARARLARDLHDSVGHAMTLVVVQAEAAGLAVRTDPDFVLRALGDISAAGRRALDELDAALAALREDATDRRPDPTLDDLPDLVRRARGAGLPVELDLDVVAGAVPSPVSAVGYRIVQEACTNVLRHAGPVATAVEVRVDVGRVRVRVRSELGRAELPAGDGWRNRRGLAGLVERARLIGGSVRAGPTSAGYWQVEATLPLTTGLTITGGAW